MGLGGDGLVPVSTLGRERFRYEEAAQALVGESSGTRYAAGDRPKLRLAEANPLPGALKFELPEGGSGSIEPLGARPPVGRKHNPFAGQPGRPGPTRLQGRRTTSGRPVVLLSGGGTHK